MRQVTRYQSNDGTLFLTAGEALVRDNVDILCEEADKLLNPGPRRDEDRVLQPEDKILAFKKAVLDITQACFPDVKAFQIQPKNIPATADASRILPYGQTPQSLSKLWFRLGRIAEDNYEYNQYYYAIHTDRWQKEYGPK